MRVRERSPIVISNVDDNRDMETGVYEVQEKDLPLKEIYQCDEDDLTKPLHPTSPPAKKAASVTTPTSTHSSRHRSSSDLWSAAAWRRFTV